MAAFNTIVVARLQPCPRCGHEGAIGLQFAHGDTWQYTYRMHDQIRWGGNDVGVRREGAEVLAYPEHCPICGLEPTGEYVLTLVQNRFAAYGIAKPEDIARLEMP